jgi:hypothetical protein
VGEGRVASRGCPRAAGRGARARIGGREQAEAALHSSSSKRPARAPVKAPKKGNAQEMKVVRAT